VPGCFLSDLIIDITLPLALQELVLQELALQVRVPVPVPQALVPEQVRVPVLLPLSSRALLVSFLVQTDSQQLQTKKLLTSAPKGLKQTPSSSTYYLLSKIFNCWVKPIPLWQARYSIFLPCQDKSIIYHDKKIMHFIAWHFIVSVNFKKILMISVIYCVCMLAPLFSQILTGRSLRATVIIL
jgi:hypothetical protein